MPRTHPCCLERRAVSVTLLAIGLGLETDVNAAVGTAASANPLRCQLSRPEQLAKGEPVVLQLALSNDGAQSVDLLVWGTPFEVNWFAPYMRVQHDGVELAYRGASRKRGDPSAADYLRIEARQSRQASFDLARAFDLKQPGRYRVLPQITLHDLVIGGPPNSARPREQHRGMALDCNAIEFDITR